MNLPDRAIANHDGLCWNCLTNHHPDDIITINIPALGYGGMFDGFSTKIQLCKQCFAKTDLNWWELNVVECKSSVNDDLVLYQLYEHEEEIQKYIDSLPLAGQELVFNTFGSDGDKMKPQDWIDFTNRTISNEKLEKYGIQIPQN